MDADRNDQSLVKILVLQKKGTGEALTEDEDLKGFFSQHRGRTRRIIKKIEINTPSGVWRSRSATAACERIAVVEGLRGKGGNG